MRLLGVLGASLAIMMSGCLAALDDGTRSADASAEDGADAAPAGERPQHRPGAPASPRPGPGDAGTVPASWPNLADATIRPGVRVTSSTGQCTSNFLFQGAGGTLYLGLAAHCVDEDEIGAPVTIAPTDGPAATGELAFSSWKAQELGCDDNAAGSGCTGGAFQNDFALIRIADEDATRTHPAMIHFGGPTRQGDPGQLAFGDRVLTYGNSGLRFGLEDSNRHEGVVSDPGASASQFSIYTVAPGVPGDSGSGVISREGEALGILVTVAVAPVPGENGVVRIDAALDLARKHGFDLQLATWDLLDDGLIP